LIASHTESGQPGEGGESRSTTVAIVRLTAMAAVAISSWLGVWRLIFPIDAIAIAAALLGGYPVYVETFRSLRHGHVNMEVSMAVAILASLLLGQFTVAVLVTFFVLLSEYIEAYAVDRGRQTVVLLEKSAPKKALVRRVSKELEVEVGSLQPGDVVIVSDGDRIPVDGTIVVGSAFVNQSAITGESARLLKGAGDKVYAGSIDESGVMEVQTEKIGNETVFGKIIQLVEEAEGRKAPIQKISDRLAAWLVEFALAFAAVTFLVTRDLTSTLSVVVVAGACGVAAGTPLALVATMGKAARSGAIVKGGAYVQELSSIDTVVIDKTGTLTFGEPVVTGIKALGCTERTVLEYASIAERHSSHPLARAVMKKAADAGIILPETISAAGERRYIPGKGVRMAYNGGAILVGNRALLADHGVRLPSTEAPFWDEAVKDAESTVLVAYDGDALGLITISDEVRMESRIAVQELKSMGIRTIMLTGDRDAVAQAVGRRVGVDDVRSELMPEDKVAIVEQLVTAGRKVAMVGDGMNDAPALARANVGIGMGGGTDVAIEEADVVLMTNDLRKIAETIRLSRQAYRTIMVNFFGTVTVDSVGVALAFIGVLNPVLAAVIHVSSELAFILNSARLIR
jgi:P-type Cu+ transporter